MGLPWIIARARGRLPAAPVAELGDFTATWRVLPLSLAGIAIGLLSAYVALALLRLIGLFTNLFFFQRWDFALVSPAGNRLGALVVLVPAAGALVIGFMARYGSERIRGHGIPEAIESILIRGSRIEAETGLTRLPVVEPGEARRLVGMIALSDLLKARVRSLEAERRRERVLPLRLLLPRGIRRRGRRAGWRDGPRAGKGGEGSAPLA